MRDPIFEQNQRAAAIDALQVGDGISWSGYSDVYAGTIIKKSANFLLVQEDLAELVNGDELKFVAGGFAAHCENQRDQRYAYSPNENGRVVKLSRRKVKARDGRLIIRWKVKGVSARDSAGNVYPGRNKFYDYNF